MQQRQIEFKMTKQIFISTILIFLTMSSCFYRDEKVDKELTVYSYDKFKYALAIKYTTEGRGNIHSFDFSKYQYQNADWVYTNRINGQVQSDSLVFTQYQDETEYPWRTNKIKGSVTFDSLNVKIELLLPVYDNKDNVKSWVPYEFNGQYRLKISDEMPPRIDPKP